jgi:N4-(beta-N-acetylglucosaminyl)-L-asparaginase
MLPAQCALEFIGRRHPPAHLLEPAHQEEHTMHLPVSRRTFAATLAAGLASLPGGVAAESEGGASRGQRIPSPTHRVITERFKKPIVISSANGYTFGATRVAFEKLQAGADTLDAVIAGVNMNENDPKDISVGYGGLPNADGVVQLDACCMHGPTNLCGAVGALEGYKNPSLVAKAVMDNTDHIFIVGEGAARFAHDLGFEKVDLLTDFARKTWLLWKETRSEPNPWGPGLDSPNYHEYLKHKAALLGIDPELQELAVSKVFHPPTGTINCMAVNEKGEISGVTTTAGLAWKIPGRVGDSPIIGAGLFVDGEIGAAGSTGRGEENIRIAGGHTVVEMMRRGMSPAAACLEALKRVANNFRAFPDRLKQVDLQYYALAVSGEYGAATLWDTGPNREPRQFAVHDGANRLEDMQHLMRRQG